MKIQKSYKILFFLFILLLTFAFIGSLSLWDQDEAAYAGFAKNMLDSGNWLIPEFMWSFIHRKPPLHFWNIALSYKIFGINEFSVRFPSALFTFSTYLIVYFWGKRLIGSNISFLSAFILSTSIFIPILAKISVTDATLLFFSTVCALAVLHNLNKPSIKTTFIFWTSFSLALLTKGPPIIIFTGTLAIIIFVAHPERKKLFRLHPWFFLPIASAPLIYWGYLAYQLDNGEFINWMIDWYIIKRISGSVLGQTGPPGTHLLFITMFFIPYLMFLPKAFWSGIKGVLKPKSENFLLGAWLVSGWLLFEFSPSKLPAYSLVAHVPLAILIAKILDNHIKTNTIPHKALIITQYVVFFLLNSALLFASFYLELSNSLKISIIIFNLLMIGSIIFSIKLIKSTKFIYSILVINLLFQAGIHLAILPQIDNFKNSTKRVALYLKENVNSESSIVLANKKGSPPSLPFYSNLYFENVMGTTSFNEMTEQYKSGKPFAFVLNHEDKQKFEEAFGKVNFGEVSSFYTDRKGKASYYILLNPEALLIEN